MSLNGLPEHWEVKRLGEVCEKVSVVKRREQNPLAPFLYLDIGGINNTTNRIERHKTYFWKDAPSRAQQIVRKNDVLFSTVRTYLKNIAYIDNDTFNDGIASSGFTVIRANKTADPKFLFYLSISQQFLKPLNELQTGSSYPAVRDKDVFAQPIPIPSLDEQERIVAKIEELFSELDAGVESLKKAQAQLKTYRQAVLKSAFEGRLTNDDVDDGNPATGWAAVAMREIVEPPKYGTSKKCGYESKGMGVLRIPNVAAGAIDSTDLKFAEFDEDEIEAYTLQRGDLLTIRSNGSVDLVGKCALVSKMDERFLFAGYLIRLRPKKHAVNPKFLLHVLSSKELRIQIESKAKSTSGVNNINSKELQSLLIPYCGLDEQVRVVEEIESRLSVCDKLEETITASLKQSEALRQSILKQAFEGKLV